MTVLQTIILAIVEGLTEFLPVSSTGHMIITQSLLGIPSDEFVKAFTVIIQFGAILSVVVLYWRRFFRLDHSPAPERASNVQRFLHKWNFYYKLLVAFLPAMVIGGLLNSVIDRLLGSVMVVAVMLVLGGVFMLFCDRLFDAPSIVHRTLSVYRNDTGRISLNGYHCWRNGPEAHPKRCS